MKLLVFTQKVDKNDSVLGFFLSWITELSKIADSVEVICLEKGDFDLPKNVTVYSLGKENKASRFAYIINLYTYLHVISGSYDRVFVHMNEEYVLMGGLYWKLRGIPVFFWRNHMKGTIWTRLAVAFSTKVFCTSKQSFTARFKKTVIMPVGNDLSVFHPVEGVVRKKYSICMLGRIAPVKHIELGLEAMKLLSDQGVQVSFDVIGSAIERDTRYRDELKQYVIDNNLSSCVNFYDEAPFPKHPQLFSGYELSLNLTDSGSFDKSIIGAASCGAIPLVSNVALAGLLPDVCITKPTPEDIAVSIQKLLNPSEQLKIQKDLKQFVESQSLESLAKKLQTEME